MRLYVLHLSFVLWTHRADAALSVPQFEAICSVLRRVAADEVLRETSELAGMKLRDAAETRARCKASCEELLRAFERRLKVLSDVGQCS